MMLILYSALFLWALWILYVAVMHLERVEARWGLTRPQAVLGKPVMWLAATMSVVANWTLAILVFLRPPPSGCRTLSQRLQHYREKRAHGDWRRRLAVWIQESLLADFDVNGGHGDPGR